MRETVRPDVDTIFSKRGKMKIYWYVFAVVSLSTHLPTRTTSTQKPRCQINVNRFAPPIGAPVTKSQHSMPLRRTFHSSNLQASVYRHLYAENPRHEELVLIEQPLKVELPQDIHPLPGSVTPYVRSYLPAHGSPPVTFIIL